jgi:hypothetical protein
MALRMSLELSIAATCFSTREVELREWEAGSVDIKWGSLTDAKNGVVSEKFPNPLAPGRALEGWHGQAIAILIPVTVALVIRYPSPIDGAAVHFHSRASPGERTIVQSVSSFARLLP